MGQKNGLTFGAEKTVAVIFNRKYKLPDFPLLTIDNHQIKYSKTVKYLGITYGAIIWAHQAGKHIKQLDRVQRLGHFTKSVPTKGLEIVTNLLPFDLFIKEHAEKMAARILGLNPV